MRWTRKHTCGLCVRLKSGVCELDSWDGMYLPANSIFGAPAYCRVVATIEANIGGGSVDSEMLKENLK